MECITTKFGHLGIEKRDDTGFDYYDEPEVWIFNIKIDKKTIRAMDYVSVKSISSQSGVERGFNLDYSNDICLSPLNRKNAIAAIYIVAIDRDYGGSSALYHDLFEKINHSVHHLVSTSNYEGENFSDINHKLNIFLRNLKPRIPAGFTINNINPDDIVGTDYYIHSYLGHYFEPIDIKFNFRGDGSHYYLDAQIKYKKPEFYLLPNPFATYPANSNWTTAEFYKIEGFTYLFLLSGHSGQVEVYKMSNNTGEIETLVETHHWTQGWTHARFFYVYDMSLDPSVYLYLFKENTGDVHIHEINTNGTVGKEIERYQETINWTSIEFFYDDFATYLLSLQENTGYVWVRKMAFDSNEVLNKRRVYMQKWSKGWSEAKPYRVKNKNLLLLYKEKTGKIHVNKINQDGSVGEILITQDWSPSLRQIEFYYYGETYMVLLAPDQNEEGILTKVYNIDEHGKVGKQILLGESAPHTLVKPYRMGNTIYYLYITRHNLIELYSPTI